jgi:hypothetical protein
MTDLNLLTQLVFILATLNLFLIVALINQIMKRKWTVGKLAQINNAEDSASKRKDLQSLTKLIPEWLAEKVKDTPYESVLGGVSEWLDYARGNLLLATAGGFVALSGALLAASQLLLFGVLGAVLMVLGLQILYSAAQDAGVLGATAKPQNSIKEQTIVGEARTAVEDDAPPTKNLT